MPTKRGERGPTPAPRRPQHDLAFSRPFDVDRLRAGEVVDIELEANQGERAALAKLLGLQGIDSLAARLQVSRHAVGVRVVGTVTSALTQNCVITLEPFSAVLDEKVDLRFAPQTEVEALEAAAARGSGDDFIDVADASNLPDPILDGHVDLGEIAAEALALGLDPYPRKPGAAFEAGDFGDVSDPAQASPFAVLRRDKPPS